MRAVNVEATVALAEVKANQNRQGFRKAGAGGGRKLEKKAGSGKQAIESKKPSRNDWAKCLNLVVPERGIEPPTFALRMRCSTV